MRFQTAPTRQAGWGRGNLVLCGASCTGESAVGLGCSPGYTNPRLIQPETWVISRERPAGLVFWAGSLNLGRSLDQEPRPTRYCLEQGGLW